MQYQQREIMSKLFMSSITIVGITIFSLSLFNLSTMPNSLLILILFVVLLGVTEYYPFPAWKGYTTINFPLIYVMLLIYGLNLTIVVYSSVVLAVNLLHERPLRSILFNPAQLAISLYLTYSIVVNSFAMHELTFSTSILNGILTYLSFLLLFYIINNLLVDIVLWLRPQPYSFVNWKRKRPRSLELMMSVKIVTFNYTTMDSQSQVNFQVM
ncbi:hypothetical protein ACTWQB_00320 [Piscibacillus sp. B03]|uniref:hypothetical protein n=1 Tax=Piscibacillus sp. B03 TaxID=3457430 RepID=UPI003FCE73BF